MCLVSGWIALSLRLEIPVLPFSDAASAFVLLSAVSLALAWPIFVSQGLYRAIFRYSGWNAIGALIRAGVLYGVTFFSLVAVVGLPGIPRSVGISQPFLLIALVAGSRMWVRMWLGNLYQSRIAARSRKSVLLYGAGEAGRRLAAAVPASGEFRFAGFIDDAEELHGQSIDGRPVFGPQELAILVQSERVAEIWLALPTITGEARRAILDRLRPLGVRVGTLPRLGELFADRITAESVRDLNVDDLLGREPVKPDEALIRQSITGKWVLVTGAGGSIGSELCRQILRRDPQGLVLLDSSESALYEIERTLRADISRQPPERREPVLIAVLGSVTDPARLRETFRQWRPEIIFHSAAYKHVPLVETNPAEGLLNNVWGTIICADAAAEAGVSSFVLVSTDKAVRPTNIMGASKRLAELYVQQLASRRPKTCFTMVRFGNVLGSSGSVVPLFQEQIAAGGPLTLTHPEVTRFFMSIPEAAQLVIQAGAMAKGGEVFLLDMGPPVKIRDLAERMAELAGTRLKSSDEDDEGIAVKITGLRSGEKLYEELLIGDDAVPTAHRGILRAEEPMLSGAQLKEGLERLRTAIECSDEGEMRQVLSELVVGFSAVSASRLSGEAYSNVVPFEREREREREREFKDLTRPG
jgi:FlaA1/EpsC-like NDP-sugar epimerase